MATMTELREKRYEIEREMYAAAISDGVTIDKRIREFLAQITTEYGLYGITYEIECSWEGEYDTDKIGLDTIAICNT